MIFKTLRLILKLNLIRDLLAVDVKLEFGDDVWFISVLRELLAPLHLSVLSMAFAPTLISVPWLLFHPRVYQFESLIKRWKDR